MFRTLGRLGTATLLVTALTSCTSDAQDSDIVILSGRDDSANGQRQALLREWNFVHKNNQARIIELSGLADQQHNEMVKDAQANDSDVDIYNLDVTWTTEFADAGYIEQFDATDTSDFLSGPLETARYRDALYALPFNTDAGLLYYRKDLVDCPTDWEGIRDAASRIAELPQPKPAAAWAGQLSEYEGLVVNVLETLHSVAPENRDLFEAGLPALQTAVDLLRPAANPGMVLPDALTYDEAASTQALRQGKVAILRNWPVARETLFATSPENPTTGRNIGVCRMPANSAVLGGQNLAVSHHSEQSAIAQELIRYLTDTQAQQRLFDDGGLAPTRKSAYVKSERAADSFTQEIRKAVSSATPRPQGRCYIRFSSLFSRTVHRSLVTGEALPDDFLDQLGRALHCKPF